MSCQSLTDAVEPLMNFLKLYLKSYSLRGRFRLVPGLVRPLALLVLGMIGPTDKITLGRK